MSRFFTQVNEDLGLFKLGIAHVLTTRGIPQIYYGTEILMKNPGTTDHGIIRSDFPGGWEGDKVNAFLGRGLNEAQQSARAFFKKLLGWRRSKGGIHAGRWMHFAPQDGFYVYFRYSETDKVMVILNKNKKETLLKLDRFKEIIKGTETGFEVVSGQSVTLNRALKVPAMSPMIIDLD